MHRRPIRWSSRRAAPWRRTPPHRSIRGGWLDDDHFRPVSPHQPPWRARSASRAAGPCDRPTPRHPPLPKPPANAPTKCTNESCPMRCPVTAPAAFTPSLSAIFFSKTSASGVKKTSPGSAYHRLPIVEAPDAQKLAREIMAAGFKAILTCVEDKLGRPFAGRSFDARLLTDLPADIDPCGENGESPHVRSRWPDLPKTGSCSFK